jgi:hypothetical protein
LDDRGSDTSHAPPDGSRYLEADAGQFRERFDRFSFAFRHRLANHPLFRMDRLFQLVQGLSKTPGEVYFDAGDVGVGQRWDNVPLSKMTVEGAMAQIESSGAWIIVRHAEKDPEFGRILDSAMAEAEALAGRPFRREMVRQHAIIFITSPNRITPYHIDKECNFILQIAGSKTISVFDRNDREVLPEDELERFWAVDNNAAIYKPRYQDRATVYSLSPGDAIHVPVNCPHWVQNGNAVSVTLSVNFWYRDTSKTDVYRANYYLRRLGLRPRPPGTGITNALKRSALPSIDLLRKARERLRFSGKAQ